MNLLRFSKPLGSHTFSEGMLNQMLRELGNENCVSVPRANVLEGKDDFKIELSVPGFIKEQISVQFQEGQLIIKGSPAEKQAENERYLIREFGLRSFIRRFSIPDTVDTELISAAFSNGILTIIIPKKGEAIEKEPKDIIVN